jgi:putative flippase GtrA
MSFLKYALLSVIILGIQSGLTAGAVSIGMNKWIVYIPVQLVVYPLSYLLQRAIVFREDRR